MIVCYRLRETGISWFKTTVYSFIMNLLLLGPTLFLGANLGNKIEEVPFLEIMMKTMVGILFFFIAVFEFLPEVMAESKTQKTWLSAIIMAGIGLIFALILVNFHQHPEHSS